jgi:hypothetical protein
MMLCLLNSDRVTSVGHRANCVSIVLVTVINAVMRLGVRQLRQQRREGESQPHQN